MFKKIIIPVKTLIVFVSLMIVLTIFSSHDLNKKYYCAGFAKASYDCYFSESLISSPWSIILSTESSVDLSGSPSDTQIVFYYIAIFINIIIGSVAIIFSSRFKSKLGLILSVFYLFFVIFLIASTTKCGYHNKMCGALVFLAAMPWSALTYSIMSNKGTSIIIGLYCFFILLNNTIIYFTVLYISEIIKKIHHPVIARSRRFGCKKV